MFHYIEGRVDEVCLEVAPHQQNHQSQQQAQLNPETAQSGPISRAKRLDDTQTVVDSAGGVGGGGPSASLEALRTGGRRGGAGPRHCKQLGTGRGPLPSSDVFRRRHVRIVD
jgi:hypothetical protein